MLAGAQIPPLWFIVIGPKEEKLPANCKLGVPFVQNCNWQLLSAPPVKNKVIDEVELLGQWLPRIGPTVPVKLLDCVQGDVESAVFDEGQPLVITIVSVPDSDAWFVKGLAALVVLSNKRIAPNLSVMGVPPRLVPTRKEGKSIGSLSGQFAAFVAFVW